MTTASISYDTDPNTARTRSPVKWDICGVQNNWNWRVEHDDDSIDDAVEYQTRFPAEDLALVHRGADESAPLLATIRTLEFRWSTITFPEGNPPRDAVSMKNTGGQGFYSKWPVTVRALGDRQLFWEYEHPVQGDNSILLLDAETGEELGSANDNYLMLTKELSQEAMDELVITGTAVQVMLVHLMSSDMTIAVKGPTGTKLWKYQAPDWDNLEESEDEDEGR
ncbi:hypothetical protein K438DRAFT_2014858 [Mycena galopus ATCC 62051]|nr:hypothetical protein K438DRAFT_2014858 [Mycena galopus ATCC 62051]